MPTILQALGQSQYVAHIYYPLYLFKTHLNFAVIVSDVNSFNLNKVRVTTLGHAVQTFQKFFYFQNVIAKIM